MTKGLPKTKNVLAKTKSECVEKLKTLKDTLAAACAAEDQGGYALRGLDGALV